MTEIGGFELDSMRNRKASRLPNPAVPFSFLSYSESAESDVMIAYSMNPGAEEGLDSDASVVQEVLEGN